MTDKPKNKKAGGRGRPPQRRARRPDPREAAVEILLAIERDGELLENAMKAYRQWARLPDRDKAFARQLVATVLRRRGQLDAALGSFLQRDPHLYIRQVLRVGAAQVLFLRTPEHAAVSEMVGLIKDHMRFKTYTGLVNAVLRKVAASGEALIAARPPEVNLPDWLAKVWSEDWGKADMRAMARLLTEVPPTHLSVKSDPDGWAEKLDGEVLPTGSVKLPDGVIIPKLKGFKDGAWWVQDLAASLPVKQLAAHRGSLKGLKVLDLCAAPGGKTLQLCAMGADVTAVDSSAHRLKRLQENLDRTNLKATIVEADILDWESKDSFDAVLLDAPCSATGTFRRHPDVLWHKTDEQVESLTRLQGRMLTRAAGWVKPGGDLVYCVCSLQRAEGEHQIAKFLSENGTYKTVKASAEITKGVPEWVSKDGNLRVLPHVLREKGGTDGFFVAHLSR